jgi:CO/xanthine dehydrogenase Mo-binding subunit
MWMGIGVTGFRNPAHVDVELLPCGRLKVYTAAKVMGQGSKTVIAQIVAQELGADIGAIEIISGDTLQTIASGVTSGSRTTYFSGSAAKKAAAELKGMLLKQASILLECKPEGLSIASGAVFSSSNPSEKLALGELAAHCLKKGASLRARGVFDPEVTFDAATGQGNPLPAYGWGANVAEVDVNLRDGSLKVVRMVAAHDVGKAVNPLIVEGQIEGGMMMGLGFALKEKFVPGVTSRFSDYDIPKIADMPEIIPILVEVPEPSGPFNAKGIGEGSSIGSGASIINAIADATGGRVFDLPAFPSRVLDAIAGADERK